eukprot:TRINITY_DN4873_c0_g1_i1.p1 TRINITY_DN4873_c0_g1~~TRINITY_DN4873_c0_g1_i1.p1  ORF type:complete len:162 (+),score=11.21 TRINITY_DN4873_c0_g1_i1:347-832(+)
MLTTGELGKLLKLCERTQTIEFVMINSPFSEKIGQVFIDNGINHVIAIRLKPGFNPNVKASRIFMDCFINHFLGKSVKQAFASGCERVHADAHVTKKVVENFRLLPKEDPHENKIFEKALHGYMQEMSRYMPPMNINDHIPPKFMRSENLQETIASIKTIA